jgi:hypothetical protein
VADRWTWIVADRITIPGRGLLVLGERTGELPIVGESCIVQSADGAVESDVRGLEMLEQSSDRAHRDDHLGHEFGLLLGVVDVEAVPVGSVVRPKVDVMHRP